MKLPRDLGGGELAKKLAKFGYVVTRQTGSHIRLTTSMGGEHHVTIPAHTALKTGTLNGILGDVAEHLRQRPDVLEQSRERHGTDLVPHRPGVLPGVDHVEVFELEVRERDVHGLRLIGFLNPGNLSRTCRVRVPERIG